MNFLYFMTHWIFIIFCWGGLVLSIYYLFTLKKYEKEFIKIDIVKFRSSLKILLTFIILASIGFSNLFITTFGFVVLQLLNNLVVGVLFVAFLVKLRKAIITNKSE